MRALIRTWALFAGSAVAEPAILDARAVEGSFLTNGATFDVS